jgi:ferredoxin
MVFFRVNEKCNGCLACVQNCPARALDARLAEDTQVLRHNMARCARCATCWRVCPKQAIEFQHLLRNEWAEVISHKLVHCEVCGELLHTVLLREGLDARLQDLAEPLCSRHRLERQAGALAGRTLV